MRRAGVEVERELNASALPMIALSSAVHGLNCVISSAPYCIGSGLRATQALTPSAYACRPAARRGRECSSERSAARRSPMVRSSTSLASSDASGADQLRQRAARLAAQHVDLEQPVLCLHPALQEERVVLVESVDVRHAVDVAHDARGPMQLAAARASRP